ncbi:MAG: hypothetical protein WC707_05715 [Candidatus Babeliaceae bacterium]|jgi:hypothetical protein
MLAKICLSIIFLLCQQIAAVMHNYITGAKFRECADYIIESYPCSWNPEEIEPKSVIYIKCDYIDYFFTMIFPRIKHPIIIISHNGDWPAPNKWASYLDDPKIIMWFGQNCDIAPHEKFCPIPIGIANPIWKHGNPFIFDAVLDYIDNKKNIDKRSQLYINFASDTNIIRSKLCMLFQEKPFVHCAARMSLVRYLFDLSQYKFILSPFGNGLDCHRTWEALLVGTIPVVKTSTIDTLYKDLPVIIVQDWDEITEDFLEEQYEKIKKQYFNKEKLFMDYWINIINRYKR